MGDHVTKRHNKTLLLYHIVCPLKYRRDVITNDIGESLKEICLQISERYEIHFIEIGYEPDHVHFLVQSVPTMNLSEIIRAIRSITAKQLFQRHPEFKVKFEHDVSECPECHSEKILNMAGSFGHGKCCIQ